MAPRNTGASRDLAGSAILRLRDVHKTYTVGANRLHVLKGIDLDIGAGELVAVMGASAPASPPSSTSSASSTATTKASTSSTASSCAASPRPRPPSSAAP
jgi:ABC-type microcin C transport system duplicated ATPase subunit YejF